jgi:hypothetical protein
MRSSTARPPLPAHLLAALLIPLLLLAAACHAAQCTFEESCTMPSAASRKLVEETIQGHKVVVFSKSYCP